MADIPPSEQIGKVLGGKYRLISLLGQGGMGRVFSAEHVLLGRPVAVKVLHPALEGNAELAERFLREARSASSIEHPGIIDILDADRDESGALYMVMELLQGESLSDFLKRSQAVDPGEAVELAREILDALYSAHEQGIIHRDLKPDNIFLVEDGSRGSRVRILDFGISKAMNDGDDELKLTRTGVVLGTPHYMAPEQARGTQELDHRIDIWAMGVILYQMLAGHRPYTGNSYNEVMLKIAVDPVPSLAELAPHIPERLVRCVEGALEKDPKQRYGSVAEMVRAMEQAAAEFSPVRLDETIATPPPQFAEPPPSQLQRAGGTEPMGTPSPAPVGERADASTQAPQKMTAAARSSGEMQASGPSEVGGFWRRMAALILDVVLFSLLIGTPLDALLSGSDRGEAEPNTNEAPALEPMADKKSAAETHTHQVALRVGEGKAVTIGDGASVVIGDETLFHLKPHSDSDKVLVWGLREGFSNFVVDETSIYEVTVTQHDGKIRQLQDDVERLVAEIPGVTVSRMGERLVLDGVVQRAEDLDRVNAVVEADKERLRSLVSLQTEPEKASAEASGPPPEVLAGVADAKVNIDEKGLRVVGDGGEEVVIDDKGILITDVGGEKVRIGISGIHIRDPSGEEVHIGRSSDGETGPSTGKLKLSLWVLFCTAFLTFFAATPGKLVLGLRVVPVDHSVETPGRLPMVTALVRSAMFIVSACALGLGCLWSLFDGERRTWHDRLARTRVIHLVD